MKKNTLLLLICNLMIICVFAQQIRYVKPGGTGNGNSWANASGSIQDMIDYTNPGGQVWVAGGNYPLAATLQMKEGVNVYGGFFGNETNINDRPKSDLDGNGTVEAWEFTHATVLNGQNARQVLNQAANFAVETIWDGVTITNGRNKDGGGAYIRANSILRNSIIHNNTATYTNSTYGGGIYNNEGTISHCMISNNSVTNNGANWSYAYGGGVYNIDGTITYSTIKNNSANSPQSSTTGSYGGGIYCGGNSNSITYCMISDNKATAANGGNPDVLGGGIYITSNSGTISNCIISRNTTTTSNGSVSRGGGIYSSGGTINITHCIVSENLATATYNESFAASVTGGGIYIASNGAIIDDCEIIGNIASVINGYQSVVRGGGICISYGTITNCTISNNLVSSSGGYAGSNGGGVYAQNSTITRSTIDNNTASSTSTAYPSNGGGICCYSSPPSNVIDCIIINNKTLISNVQNGYGGGIYQGTITRCRIENNSSGEGGGFYGSSISHSLLLNNSATTNGGGGFVAANGTSFNSTFVGNTAGSRGGGIYFSTNIGTSGTNCIFWQNYAPMWEQVGTPAGSSYANTIVTYSAVQDDFFSAGTGNIIIAEDNPPMFFNSATHNYQLQENSPCIDVGNNAVLTASDTTDLAGNTRIYGGTVDMGAYEWQGVNAPTVTISGKVTHNGNPLAGVNMDGTAQTNALGEYSITLYKGATTTITPSLEGYGFSPISITFHKVTSNLENKDFTAIAVIPVTNITDVPEIILPNVPYKLTGTVVPGNATHKTIIWSVANAGTTGATITTGNTLNTTAVGTLVLTATIIDGITLGVNYVQNFTITTSLNFYCGGDGTSINPYQICTPHQLNSLAIYINAGNGNTTSGRYYKLMNDIDLSSYDNWLAIGNNSVNNNTHRFQGHFDGNKKVVRNLTISTSANYQGLFGYATGGSIQNLALENCNINGGIYTGGLVGYNSVSISNCYVTGYVKGLSFTGGFAGHNASTITNCYATAHVSGTERVGGFSGNNTSTITNSYAGGTVKTTGDYTGGLVGYNDNSGTIRNCIAANDSVMTTLNIGNINRVCGYASTSGTLSYNYAFGLMVVQRNGSDVYFYSTSNASGTNLSPVSLRSLSFYNTASNWYSTSTAWSIADPSGIWAICDGEGLPFLRWQEIECNGVPPIFCSGNGTSANPYQICTVQDLKYLADFVNAGNGENTSGKFYKLMNNIDLSSFGNWTPIGTYKFPADITVTMRTFQGTFDGNGKKVQNLTIASTSDFQGLFGSTSNGTIQNLGIENCNVTGNDYVGSLVGYAGGGVAASISNCYATGYVNATGNYAGGLAGQVSGGDLYNCYATANVNGDSDVGGLVGYYSSSSNIQRSYASGKVRGSNYVGGVVGYCSNSSSLRNLVAANDSVIATAPSGNVNRICGYISGTSYREYTYALNTMIVQRNNVTITVTDNTAHAGLAQSISTLRSRTFYSTASNWNSGAWDINDPNGIWKICNLYGFPFMRYQNIECDDFVAVTNITGVPTAAIATMPLTLTGTVAPANATNQTITWSVYYTGGTGATIESGSNILNTTTFGTATIRATITKGTSPEENYYKDFYITVGLATLSGIVTIEGNAVFGEILTANTTGLTSTPTISNIGTFNYSWYRNSNYIPGANSSTYELVQADIGQPIKVVVAATNCTGTITSALTATVVRADAPTPAAPTLASATDNSITLNTIANGEYRRDGGAWQSSATFSGLMPGTSYSFTQRTVQTATHLQSAESPAASHCTTGQAFVPVTDITGVPTTATATMPLTLTGTVAPANATNQTITWSVVTPNTAGGSISGGNTLNTTTSGTVTVRATITNGLTPTSNFTKDFTIAVDKATQTPPSAPTLSSKTKTSITLNAITGCEYRMDGSAWQTSTLFDGLTANTTYSFQARKAETATYLASDPSPAVSIITDPIGIHENEFAGVNIYCYQNIVHIKNESNITLKSVEIFDMTGRVVYQNNITDVETVIPLQAPTGIYHVSLVSQDEKMMTKKVLILQ